MKQISGWIGVALVLISFLIQLWIMLQEKRHYKFFIIVQIILIIGGIFWLVYAFYKEPIYWPTGINNVLVIIFNFIFLIINWVRWSKNPTKNHEEKSYLK